MTLDLAIRTLQRLTGCTKKAAKHLLSEHADLPPEKALALVIEDLEEADDEL